MKHLFITITFIVLAIANALAQTFTVDGLNYTIIDGTTNVSITGGSTNLTGELIIPTQVENNGVTYSVTSIERYAFSSCSDITSVTIPRSITSMESGAFVSCSSLTKVTINSNAVLSKTIINAYTNYTLKGIFGNQVTEYILGDDITTIGESAFSGCSNLTSVTIPNSVTSIPYHTFWMCSSLTTVIIPNSVTRIGSQAFTCCSSLTTIYIPNSVTTISRNAFEECKLCRICCESTSKPTGWEYDWNKSTFKTIWNVKRDGDFIYTITSNSPREVTLVGYVGTNTSIVIPSKASLGVSEYIVTDIMFCSFYYCEKLTQVIIPNTITSIGENAFNHCSNLKKIDIPNSVSNIGGYAFDNCRSLISITIPSSVSSMGSNVLDLCNNLSYISISSSTPPTITQSTFTNFDASIPVYIPCGSLSKYTSANYWNGLNFIEDFTYQFEVISADESKGSVEIVTAPTCSSAAVIKAVSNTDYAFYGWSDGNIENPRTIAVTQDTILTAFFEKYVTANISSSDNARGYTSNNTTIFKYGETITVSAIANKGYYFTQWSDGETANPRTLTLTEDVEFNAQFGVYQYKIVLQSNNPAMGNVSGSGTFDYNTTNTITATANPNHLFVNWSDGVTDNPRQMLLTKDTLVTALFANENNVLQVKSSNLELGLVSGSNNYYYGTTASISATATAAHYHFVQWNDGNRQNPRQVTVVCDTQFVATFGIDTFSVAAKCDTAMGAVSGARQYSYGSAAKVEAKPAAHHHFVQWTSGAVQSTQEFVVEHDTAFEAVFAIDRHTVALAASDSLCGAVSGAGSYDYGASVQLQATPAANCYFTGWSDGVTTNPRTLTVEGDTNIVAEFGKLQTVNIIVAANNTLRGTVAGTGSYVVGSNATLSATASAHYLFEQWSDGRTDNPRTVRAIADATFTAVFVPMQYNIILSQNNADMGMVSGSGVYSYGERVSCLAKPYQNYHFVQWSNGSTENPYEFVVEEDMMLTAYFAAGAVTAIGNESAIEPTIYAIGKTIVVENATDEICVYDAMGKLICRDAIHRVRAELRVNAAGVYIVKTGNVVMRVVVE